MVHKIKFRKSTPIKVVHEGVAKDSRTEAGDVIEVQIRPFVDENLVECCELFCPKYDSTIQGVTFADFQFCE